MGGGGNVNDTARPTHSCREVEIQGAIANGEVSKILKGNDTYRISPFSFAA